MFCLNIIVKEKTRIHNESNNSTLFLLRLSFSCLNPYLTELAASGRPSKDLEEKGKVFVHKFLGKEPQSHVGDGNDDYVFSYSVRLPFI